MQQPQGFDQAHKVALGIGKSHLRRGFENCYGIEEVKGSTPLRSISIGIAHTLIMRYG
jgi:hypothetical protein